MTKRFPQRQQLIGESPYTVDETGKSERKPDVGCRIWDVGFIVSQWHSNSSSERGLIIKCGEHALIEGKATDGARRLLQMKYRRAYRGTSMQLMSDVDLLFPNGHSNFSSENGQAARATRSPPEG